MEEFSNIGDTSRHDIAQMLGMREKDMIYADQDFGCRVSALRPDEEVEVISSKRSKRRQI